MRGRKRTKIADDFVPEKVRLKVLAQLDELIDAAIVKAMSGDAAMLKILLGYVGIKGGGDGRSYEDIGQALLEKLKGE